MKHSTKKTHMQPFRPTAMALGVSTLAVVTLLLFAMITLSSY